MDVSWTIDFFTVTTINFATVYVFLVCEHGRRRVVHLATAQHPSMEWVIQQLRNAMPSDFQLKHLFRDNDGPTKLVAVPALGGLHHRHLWVAA